MGWMKSHLRVYRLGLVAEQYGHVVVGVCYRVLDQEEEMDEAFFRQLEVSYPLILAFKVTLITLMWQRDNTAVRNVEYFRGALVMTL